MIEKFNFVTVVKFVCQNETCALYVIFAIPILILKLYLQFLVHKKTKREKSKETND